MKNQVEISNGPQQINPEKDIELQKTYIGKLIESFHREIRNGYSTVADCVYRLAAEQHRPIYCQEVIEYIRHRLYNLADETADDVQTSYLRQTDRILEESAKENGELAEATRSEMDNEFYELTMLWHELKSLKRQLLSTRTPEEEELLRQLDDLEVTMYHDFSKNPGRKYEWVHRLTNEFPRPSYEIQLRINWLVYRIECGDFDSSGSTYYGDDEPMFYDDDEEI